MSKRKYNVELLNDEEDAADEQLSGLNIFKKAKAAASDQVVTGKSDKEGTHSEGTSTNK